MSLRTSGCLGCQLDERGQNESGRWISLLGIAARAPMARLQNDHGKEERPDQRGG
jgi:hypothetical protein